MKREKPAKPVSDELIDQWLKDGRKPEDVNDLLKQITKAVLERAMQAEMTEHLGYEKHEPAGVHTGNSRNGVTRKTLKGDFGQVEIETPRDRNGGFEPQIVHKRQTVDQDCVRSEFPLALRVRHRAEQLAVRILVLIFEPAKRSRDYIELPFASQ